MAINTTALNLVLNQIFAGAIANQLNNRSVLLKLLRKTVGSGKNIAFDVKVARGTTAGSYAEAAAITGDDNDTEVPAVLAWKRYKSEFRVTGLAEAIAASSGPEAYTKLLGKAIEDATSNLANRIANHVYGDGTGNSGLDLDGLDAIIANSGTYAGISRGTYATWRGNVQANSGTPRALTKELIQTAHRQVLVASGAPADVMVCNPAVYDKYEALFESITRVNGGDTYDIGAGNLAFRGVPLLRDPFAPAGKLYVLNMASFEFEQLPHVSEEGGIQLTQAERTMVTDDGEVGLQVGVEVLGKTGDFYPGFVKLYGNLKNEHPNRNAVIADINEA